MLLASSASAGAGPCPPVLGRWRTERRRGARLRGGGRRPQLPLGVDDDRLAGPRDRPAADPGDVGAGLIALGPEPDHLRLPGLAVVGDVDVVRAGGEVLAGAEAEGEVGAAGAVLERIRSEGEVLVAGRVGREGGEPRGEVVAAGGVGEEREGPGCDVVGPVDVRTGRRRRRRRCRGRSCS